MTQVDQKLEGAIYKFESADGSFKRPVSSFRNWISTEKGARFPPEAGRYVSCHPSHDFVPISGIVLMLECRFYISI